MFVAKIQSRGLPGPDGTVRGADQVFEFSFCLAQENGDRWLMGAPSYREDRCLYLPVSELQGEWLAVQADLMTAAGIELSWWLRGAWAAFELVERLGDCRIGPSLQARYLAEDHDIIAPPKPAADAMLANARAALDQGKLGSAFDIASRLLAGEGYRIAARTCRARVLDRFGCFEDARRERDMLALLGAPRSPEPAIELAMVYPRLDASYRAVAIELQGLPLDYPAVDNHLVRYLYRVDVPRAPSGGPWLVRMPEAEGIAGAAELPEQSSWLVRTGVREIEGLWQVDGEPAQEVFIMAVQNGLATTDRWQLANRIRSA